MSAFISYQLEALSQDISDMKIDMHFHYWPLDCTVDPHDCISQSHIYQYLKYLDKGRRSVSVTYLLIVLFYFRCIF